jgi:cytochrome oxidase Cu insertion factor (SCO1/SenC/PrrC family)
MLVLEKNFLGIHRMVSITIDPEHDTAKVLQDHRIFWV